MPNHHAASLKNNTFKEGEVMKDDEEAFLSIERVIAHAPQKNDRLAVKCRSDQG